MDINPNYVELEDLRQKNMRIFAHKDNIDDKIAIVASSNCCYQTEDGKFDLVDLNLDLDYNNYVGSITHDHNVYFKKSSKGVICIFGYGANRYYGYQLPDDVNDVTPEFDGNNVIYKNIYPGIDILFENTRVGINKNFIIHSIRCYRDLSIKIVASKVNVEWDDDHKLFYVSSKETGERLWRSATIDISDSSLVGPPQLNYTSDLIVDFYKLSDVLYELKMKVTREFIKKLKFPIYIDPSVNPLTASWSRSYQSSYTSRDYPNGGVSGVITDGGKFIGRYVVVFSGFPSGATKVNAGTKAHLYMDYSSNWGVYTFIRQVTSWPSGGAVGWGNRPTDFSGYEGSSSSRAVGWSTFDCPTIVGNWMIRGNSNLGFQFDSYDYEDKSDYAWRKWRRPGEANEPYLEIYYETNTAPSRPVWVEPGNSARYESTIPFTWAASTDSENDAITYKVLVDKGGNNNNWVTVATGITGTAYNYDISGDTEGTKYNAAVVANDSHYDSDTAYIPGYIYKNKKPTAPTDVKPQSGFFPDTIRVSWTASTDPENDSKTYNVYVSKNDGDAFATIIGSGPFISDLAIVSIDFVNLL
jgi:hypothetical protein